MAPRTSKSSTLIFRMPPEMREWLEVQSKASGKSMSKVMNDIIVSEQSRELHLSRIEAGQKELMIRVDKLTAAIVTLSQGQ